MKTKMKQLAIVLLVLLFFAACNNAKKDKDVIKIGVILPLTGELASYGNPMKIGINMAYAKLDSTKFKLIFINSKGENKTATNGLQELINIHGVKYVIGDVSSSTTIAMIKIAESNNVFMLSPGASSPKLKNISKYFARNYPSSIEESVNSAKFIFENLDKSSVAVIYVNDEYGNGLASLFKEELMKQGGNILLYESYETKQSDFKTLLEKVRRVKPEVIYLAGNQKEMGKFMKQYKELGINSQIVSNISFLEADCINVAGEAADGTIVPLPYYNPEDSTYTGAYNFGKLFFSKNNKYPTVAEAVGYDALMLMVESIQNGNNEPIKAAEYIRNLKNYDGALGKLNFNDGEVSIPVVFKVVKEGKPVDFKK